MFERLGADAMGLVHPTRVRLNRAHIIVDGVLRALAPSLAATAEVKTGWRRIEQILLTPLGRPVREAGRER